jgi:hypothetical protein
MGRNALPEGRAKEATIGVAVSFETRDRWHAEAAARGMKAAAMIREAVVEFLENHPLPGKRARASR